MFIRTTVPRIAATLLLALGLTGTAGPAAPAADAPGTKGLNSVVPAPESVEPDADASFTLSEDTRIQFGGQGRQGKEAKQIAGHLAGLLRPSTGYDLPVTTASGARDDVIVLSLGGADHSLGDEGYRLTVSHDRTELHAAAPAGLFHGVQTLRQLLPPEVESKDEQKGPWTVPGGTITDKPRYAYRGSLLDPARHFLSVAQVKRYINQLAAYKINYLSLHMTDDQGWRIQIDSWPNLTKHGASTDGDHGPGGFYTKADYQEIVRYAQSRFITIVPEIEMPGHVGAALSSYAELNCSGVAPPMLEVPGEIDSLCVDKEVTYRFIDDVVREVAAITPGPYLHIGADEAYGTKLEDYRTFTDRAQAIVAKHGKTVIGWHELAKGQPTEGTMLQYWGTEDGTYPPPADKEKVAAAAQAGTKLIMSPADRTYLDMKYSKDTESGLDWAGYTEVRDSYDWDPATAVEGAPASATYGVATALWGETVDTNRQMDYLTFPRLPAVAEVGWSAAKTHDWPSFRERLAAQGPRWDAQQIYYYHSSQVPWPNK